MTSLLEGKVLVIIEPKSIGFAQLSTFTISTYKFLSLYFSSEAGAGQLVFVIYDNIGRFYFHRRYLDNPARAVRLIT